MKPNNFPDGWNEERVRALIRSYEQQTAEEATAEDEAGIEDAEALVSVPCKLLPEIRALIAKHQR